MLWTLSTTLLTFHCTSQQSKCRLYINLCPVSKVFLTVRSYHLPQFKWYVLMRLSSLQIILSLTGFLVAWHVLLNSSSVANVFDYLVFERMRRGWYAFELIWTAECKLLHCSELCRCRLFWEFSSCVLYWLPFHV